MSARQRRSRCATCGASAALYITSRRPTTAAAATVTATGESTATSWQTTSCAMPENERMDSAMPSTGVMPAETAATPATRPNGSSPTIKGATSLHPARNSRRSAESNIGEKPQSIVCYHRAMKKIVLLRHGESAWNRENRFTGWTDVGLSEKGVGEARAAGRLLASEGYDFDFAFTSVLTRAITTLNLVLEEMQRVWLPVEKEWRLNERHY